jgi:hypothetical protein
MLFGDQYKIVPIYHEYDLSTHDTTQPSDSWNMKDYHHATIILQYNTLGGASTVAYVYSGTSAAALTSALTFYYAFSGADTGTATAGSATSCDVLAAWSTSAALTVTHGTYTDRMLVIEVPATAMDLANNEEWMTVNHTDPSTGATGTVSGFAILHPRYAGARMPTCLA